MAHVKGAGTTSLGRDSRSQRLGVKLYQGQLAKAGSIIVRQRGTRYQAGTNVQRAHDDSLFATVAGTVTFKQQKRRSFTGKLQSRQVVSVTAAK